MTLPLAVSVGCPCGVGPEITVKAAASSPAPLLLVGDEAQLRGLAERFGVDLARHTIVAPGPPLAPEDRLPGAPTAASGAFQLSGVDQALDEVLAGRASAVVTGPVSKAVIASSGAPGALRFRGHTEHLQERLGADEVVMAFHTDRLVTALVTTHLPLRNVADAITPLAVSRATFWLATLLRSLGKSSPHLTIASLNPHAGEDGLLGHEERDVLRPGIDAARARLLDTHGDLERLVLDGPLGAETAFRRMKDGLTDGVVAMYHDQGTIPMKLLGFGEAVNVTLGLPVIRTSVDHGTGYDRAGSGTADERGLLAAITLATRLVAGQKAPG